MTRKSVLGLAVVFLFAGCAHVTSRPSASWGNTPVPKSAADLNWTDLDPTGAPGVKIAKLWGDPATGAFDAFFKLPSEFAAIQAPDGAPEFRLGPGSYLMQPGGNYRHTTRCDTNSECVFFVESDGPFDLKVAR